MTYCNEFDLLTALKMMDTVVDDNHGNVSCRTGANEFYIKPSGMPYSEIQAEDLVRVYVKDNHWKDLQIESVRDRKPSVDLVNHLAIYRKFPEVEAICHTHSPYVVAWAANSMSIPCATTEQADRFGGDILCTTFLSDPDAWGEHVKLLGPHFTRKAALLAFHGGLTFAKDPVEAVKLAAHLEDVAKKAHLAYSLHGRYPKNLGVEEADLWYSRYNTKYGQ